MGVRCASRVEKGSAMLARYAVGIALAVGCSAAALANSLVVGASGPSAPRYKVGSRLASGEQVRLAAGDQLSIIDNGAMRTLRGPGSYRVGATAVPAAKRSLLKTLMRDGTTRRARPGAVRGPPPVDLPASAGRRNLWHVDGERDTVACFVPAAGVQVWRRKQSVAETYQLRDAAGGAVASARIGKGIYSETVATPAQVRGGAAYSLEAPGGRRIALRPVQLPGAGVAEEEAVAALGAELARNGCTAQLDTLARMLAAADSAG